MVVRLLRSVLALSFALVVASCSSGGHSIMLEVTAEADIREVSVTVVSIDQLSTSDRLTRVVDRTRASLFADPLRLVISVRGGGMHIVHVEARDVMNRRLVGLRCYDVSSDVRDHVHLVALTTVTDADQDGYPADPTDACFDVDESGRPRACTFGACPQRREGSSWDGYDCNDTPGSGESISPIAIEICGDGRDQNCRADGMSRDEACADFDGDGYLGCGAVTTCDGGRCPCDCAPRDPSTHPGAPDPCGDALDQDCDGADDLCDADCDGFVAGAIVAADCNDSNPNVRPGRRWDTPENEVLGDGDRLARNCARPSAAIQVEDCSSPDDDDCNGRINDGCSGGVGYDDDGAAACVRGVTTDCDLNDCNSLVRPGARSQCGNDIDESTGQFGPDDCPADDADGDGDRPISLGGRDCNDAIPWINGIGAVDRCPVRAGVETGGIRPDPAFAENCGELRSDCATVTDGDGDGYPPGAGGDCDDGNPLIHPAAFEICDPAGVDEDCDGLHNEFDGRTATNLLGTVTSDRVCVLDVGATTSRWREAVYASDLDHCGGCGIATNRNEGEGCCGGNVTPINVATSCGSCGHSCGGNAHCTLPPGGSYPGYVCECDANRLDCDGPAPHRTPDGGNGCEVDALTDVRNCGGCGNVCSVANGTPACVNGRCVVQTCSPGFANCDDNYENGCELSIATTPTSCGTCSDATAASSACGACRFDCGTVDGPLTSAMWGCSSGTCNIVGCSPDSTGPLGNCDTQTGNGCETQLYGSVSRCGGCGVTCGSDIPSANVATWVCPSGSCNIQACSPNFDDCNRAPNDGCEASLLQTNRCGSCNNRCMGMNANWSCPSGTCAVTSCAAGFGNCNGSSTDGCETALSVIGNCGVCGETCSTVVNATATCQANACDHGACTAGFGDCDGNRANGCESGLDQVGRCGACNVNCNMRVDHATPICSSGSCDYMGACMSGWFDCDGNRANGCERNTACT